MSLGVECHTLGAVLTLGGLELVEDMPVSRQLLPEKALRLSDVVKLFI